MARLAIHLLGAFRVQLDGKAVTGFRTNKARALLAYLAVEAQQPHQRARLAGLLWPEWPEAQARTYLRQALADLRHVLDDSGAPQPFLLTSRDAIQFNPASDAWLDVAVLSEALAGLPRLAVPTINQDTVAQLSEAVALYRGGFLEGLYLDGCSAFEEWQLLTRERLQRQVVEALGLLIQWHADRDGLAQATRYAWQRVELEPLLEEGHRQLMRLLARGGERNMALAHYQRYCRLLDEELGAGPSPAMAALVEELRAETPAERDEGVLYPCFPFPASPRPRVATTVFVAREAELEQLDAHLAAALAGQGHVVYVVGDAGEGKSALIQEFVRRAQDAHPDLLVAGGHCSSHRGLGDPFLPFREILAQLTGDFETRWTSGEISHDQAQRLYTALPHTIDALLTYAPDLVDALIPRSALVQRVTLLLGEQPSRQQLATQIGRPAPISSAAGARRSAIFEQFTGLMQRIAARQPLLLWIENLHWVDLDSAALLFHFGAQLAGHPILIMGSYRPEEVAIEREGRRHPLARVLHEQQHLYGDINVDLSRAEGHHFVDAYLDTEPNRLDQPFRDTLYRMSSGHPLFTVELVRSMQERGDLVANAQGCWVAAPTLDWQRLPARVEAVIAERIQRLPGALRALLSVASVQGERFTAEVIAHVLGEDVQSTVHQLSQELVRQHRLVAAEGIQRLGEQRLARYRFRHILFQQYLYANLDVIERTRLHEQVACTLEELYQHAPEELSAISGHLAWHFEQADCIDKALPYRLQASERAISVSAHHEALDHFENGLALLLRLPQSTRRARSELDVQMGLATTLGSLRGHAHPDFGRAYARTLELWQHAESPPDIVPFLWGLWRYHFVRGEVQISKALAEQLLVQVEQAQQPLYRMEAHEAMGVTRYALGEFAQARAELEEGLAVGETEAPLLTRTGGQDPAVISRLFLAFVLWFQGFPHQAEEQIWPAITRAEQLGDLFSAAFAHVSAASLFAFQRSAEETARQAEIAVDLAAKHGFPQWHAWGSFLYSWATGIQAPRSENVVAMHRALEAWEATGAKIWGTRMRAMLAEMHATVGQADAGLALLGEALRIAEATGESYYTAEIHRLKGELLFQTTADAIEAEACFQLAIAVARRQQAKSLELRAMLSLCRLWQAQGKTEEARLQLATLYSWFTEGFDAPDLRAANVLLGELHFLTQESGRHLCQPDSPPSATLDVRRPILISETR